MLPTPHSLTPPSNLIWLLTDFGLKDSYVAEVKASILSASADARIIDITHEIVPGDITSAAIVLRNLSLNLPTASIVVGIVDPGVGTSRSRLCVEAVLENESGGTTELHLLAPDNGLLSLLPIIAANYWLIDPQKLPRRPRLSTFDGRDVFAQVAALLVNGEKPSSFASILENEPRRIALPLVRRFSEGVEGEIVYVDHFGNAISNVHYLDVQGITNLEFSTENQALEQYATYAGIPSGKLGVICSSQGYFEIARNGSAAELPVGTRILAKKSVRE